MCDAVYELLGHRVPGRADEEAPAEGVEVDEDDPRMVSEPRLDQPLNLGLGQVLAATKLSIWLPPQSDCSFFGYMTSRVGKFDFPRFRRKFKVLDGSFDVIDILYGVGTRRIIFCGEGV